MESPGYSPSPGLCIYLFYLGLLFPHIPKPYYNYYILILIINGGKLKPNQYTDLLHLINCYFPFQSGGLFSKNAFIPSF